MTLLPLSAIGLDRRPRLSCSSTQRGKRYRVLGVTYLAFLAIMMALHAKDYYLAPIYPDAVCRAEASSGKFLLRQR